MVLILILVLVFILFLLLELGQTQVVASLLVIRVATQGMLVELDRLVILLTAVGDIAQIITCLATQLLVLCALGKVGEDALGLFHGVLVVIFLRSDATLPHERGGQVELGLLAGRIGLEGLAVLDLGLGIAFFLIQLVAVAQAHPFLFGHLGSLVLGHRRRGCTQRQNNCQRDDDEITFYLVESHCLR